MEGFLHRQCANTTLGVLTVHPEVDGARGARQELRHELA